MTKVSIILINYHGSDFIPDCLKAIERQSFNHFEILMIDNASTDGSLDKIKFFLKGSSLGSRLKLISLKKNIGFAGGSLEGLKHVNGEYIGLLNSDTDPDKTWLEELVLSMDNDPKVGICASKLLVHNADVIDSAGDGFSFLLKGFKRGEGRKTSMYDKREYVFGACAGAALYRRRMVEEIGFFDDDFFLIHEDTDLNFRAQLLGWKVLYVPTAIVNHKVRSSIGKMSDMAVYYTLRNSEFVRIKNIPFGMFVRCFHDYIFGILSEFIFFVIKHKRLRLYFKAKIDAMRMLPRMFKKRAVIMKSRRVSCSYLLSMMTPVWEKEFVVTKIKKFLDA